MAPGCLGQLLHGPPQLQGTLSVSMSTSSWRASLGQPKSVLRPQSWQEGDEEPGSLLHTRALGTGPAGTCHLGALSSIQLQAEVGHSESGRLHSGRGSQTPCRRSTAGPRKASRTCCSETTLTPCAAIGAGRLGHLPGRSRSCPTRRSLLRGTAQACS